VPAHSGNGEAPAPTRRSNPGGEIASPPKPRKLTLDLTGPTAVAAGLWLAVITRARAPRSTPPAGRRGVGNGRVGEQRAQGRPGNGTCDGFGQPSGQERRHSRSTTSRLVRPFGRGCSSPWRQPPPHGQKSKKGPPPALLMVMSTPRMPRQPIGAELDRSGSRGRGGETSNWRAIHSS